VRWYGGQVEGSRRLKYTRGDVPVKTNVNTGDSTVESSRAEQGEVESQVREGSPPIACRA